MRAHDPSVQETEAGGSSVCMTWGVWSWPELPSKRSLKKQNKEKKGEGKGEFQVSTPQFIPHTSVQKGGGGQMDGETGRKEIIYKHHLLWLETSLVHMSLSGYLGYNESWRASVLTKDFPPSLLAFFIPNCRWLLFFSWTTFSEHAPVKHTHSNWWRCSSQMDSIFFFFLQRHFFFPTEEAEGSCI